MATRNDFVIAREGGVVLNHQTAAAGSTPTTWDAIGCPKGTWTFGRQVAEVDDNLDNWCITQSAAIESFSPGAMSLDVSGSMELILDDTAYTNMLAAIDASSYNWLQADMTDVDAVNNDQVTYGGYLTQFNHQFQGTGPSDIAVAFRGNEIGV